MKSKQNPIRSLSEEKNRPKKRSRKDLDDPFDLNRLIGIHSEVSSQESMEEKRDNRNDGVDNINELDLNVSIDEGCGDQCNATGSTVVLDLVEEVVDVVDHRVAKGMEETVVVGEVVGVNLSGHMDLVKEVVGSEGIYVVSR